MNRPQRREAGNTLPELMVTALIIGVFFAGIFEVSAVSLEEKVGF